MALGATGYGGPNNALYFLPQLCLNVSQVLHPQGSCGRGWQAALPSLPMASASTEKSKAPWTRQQVPVHSDPSENTGKPVTRLTKTGNIPISQRVTEARGVRLLWAVKQVLRMFHTWIHVAHTLSPHMPCIPHSRVLSAHSASPRGRAEMPD